MQFSLISRGPEQMAIKAACDDLGIKLISYSPLGLGMLTGKYGGAKGALPQGPRALLFRQILPGLQPLLDEMQSVAESRKKSVPQVQPVLLCLCQAVRATCSDCHGLQYLASLETEPETINLWSLRFRLHQFARVK